MASFERKIDIKHLDHLGTGAVPWLDDLFKHWAPAGSAVRTGANEALRFAIRNGYVNFYAKGQSIAKVSMGPNAFKALVHEKYCEPDTTKRALLGQRYQSVGAGDPGNVANWIAVATGLDGNKGHTGAEKRFVEKLVAENPDVIDLEMTLPAIPQTRSAIRMDLVALEPCDAGWNIVFWEAKIVNNPEARAKGSAIPKVLNQQQRYRDWLNTADHKSDVLTAYRNVCRDLVAIHEKVTSSGIGADLPALGKGIVAIAENPALLLGVDDKVRLVIDNSTGDKSFEENGHLAKLVDAEIHVQVVSNNRDCQLHGPAA